MYDDGTYLVFNTTPPLWVNGLLYVNSAKVGIGTTAPSVALHVAGEVNITGINADGTGKAVCIMADQTLGTCTDAVGASGTCTCA